MRFRSEASLFLGSIVVSIFACHARDPGSIPGRGAFLHLFGSSFLYSELLACVWRLKHGVPFSGTCGSGTPLKSPQLSGTFCAVKERGQKSVCRIFMARRHAHAQNLLRAFSNPWNPNMLGKFPSAAVESAILRQKRFYQELLKNGKVAV